MSTLMTFPPPQPVVVYPHSVSRGSSHSKGSFGPVFIALAIITVIAMLACFLGRICCRRYSRSKARHDHSSHTKGDLEDGFNRNMRGAKPVNNGELRESKTAANGGTKGEARHDHSSHTKGDLEDGFNRKMQGTKPVNNGKLRESKAAANGGTKGEATPSHTGASKEGGKPA